MKNFRADTLRFLFALILMASGNVLADSLYRWVDQSGNIHYGDLPATDATQIEKKKFDLPADMPAGTDLPYETRLAQKNFPVTLYTTTNCDEPCQQARDFLDKRGIPFAERKLVTQADIDDFKKQSGGDKSPTLAVGRTYIIGFQAERWNDELDVAGYPKALPYRPVHPPVAPAEATPAAEMNE